MGTKNNPGVYDCYANAHGDEPMFVLLGRDELAPERVEEWAARAEAKGKDPAKVAEARQCAAAMRDWRKSNKLAPPLPVKPLGDADKRFKGTMLELCPGCRTTIGHAACVKIGDDLWHDGCADARSTR